ncbi:E3 ubiquitin-protein ligase TRIM45-like [Branchiostoma floridae x Branchiostoma japonicum]
MESLVEALAEQNNIRHSKDGIHCTNCDESKAATSRCSECAEFLCTRCESAHRVVKATKGHTLFTFEELKIGKYDNVFKDRKAPLCSKHPGEILKLYCRTCETPICNECALFEHRDAQHYYTRIEKVATEKRKAILDLTLQCQAQIKFFHREEDVQKHLKQHLLENAEEARKNVRSTVQSLITLVKEEGHRLLAWIDTEVGCRKKQIEAGVEGAQISLASAKSTCEFAETLAREGGDYEVALFSREMTQTLTDLARPRFHTVDFESANVTVDYSVMKKKLVKNSPTNAQYGMSLSTEKELSSKLRVSSLSVRHSTVGGKKADQRRTVTTQQDPICYRCWLTVSVPPTYLPCRSQGCKGTFCTKCLVRALKKDPRCPVCLTFVPSLLLTNQPKGRMKVSTSSDVSLEGYDQFGAIIVDFVFQDGIQDGARK